MVYIFIHNNTHKYVNLIVKVNIIQLMRQQKNINVPIVILILMLQVMIIIYQVL